MKRICTTKRLSVWKAAVILLLALVCALFAFGAPKKHTASAYDNYDVMEIQKYHTDITVQKDRRVVVKESITVKFLAHGLSMFYRSLPTDGAAYEDITASCNGNSEFSYYVADNPDVDGFIDINCVGNAQKGNTWTYDLTFTMLPEKSKANTENGMLIDVVPFGFMVPLHNVTVDISLPAKVQPDDVALYVGYGAQDNNANLLTQFAYDETTGETKLSLAAETLEVAYNETYGEYVAKGITVGFTLPKGTLDSYAKTRIFTAQTLWILLSALGVVAVAVGILLLTRKKHEIIPIVNIKAPDEMDPMKMGKLLDGTVDSEDVTSMIYYFADKGYLSVNLEDEDDPLLLKKVNELPDDAPVYQKTLFNGLFATGESVRASQLKYHFCHAADRAVKQIPHRSMYQTKSRVGFFAGGIIGLAFAFLSMFILGLRTLGGGYTYFMGITFIAPILLIVIFAEIRENYRYKWKKGKLFLFQALQILIAGLFTWAFVGLFGTFFSTGYQRFIVAVAAFAATFITIPALSRREDYCNTLGDILGFKEFIVVTEEDKIKYMLEQNPELYYKVLPYAQVLGVTDEWEKKFENILLQPPAWCVGSHMTVFDYLILNRCMRSAVMVMMTRPQGKGNGSFTGFSGGGGGFGGFGGGGFGGGGGGAR